MSSDESIIPRVNVLGVGVSSINLAQATEAIDDALRRRRKGYICFAGVHPVMAAQADPELKRVYNRSFLTTPDGMPQSANIRIDVPNSIACARFASELTAVEMRRPKKKAFP